MVGQALYFEATGEFVTDQRAFTRQVLAEQGKSIPPSCSAYADFLRTYGQKLAA